MFTSKFESYWIPHSCDLVPYLSQNLCKLLNTPYIFAFIYIYIYTDWQMSTGKSSALSFNQFCKTNLQMSNKLRSEPIFLNCQKI